MKIAFFTEMAWSSKVNRKHKNMRTEFAWMCALDADHFPINFEPIEKYDIGIVIIPKKNPGSVDIQKLKKWCTVVCVMQEGPHWYFQDYDLANQIHYYNSLQAADIILCHNTSDEPYYDGLLGFNKAIYNMPSLMITDAIQDYITPPDKRSGIMIGGNFKSWYGGFDSYMIASDVNLPMSIPTMGRHSEGEDKMEGLTQLPYMNWSQWISKLSEHKIGIHMMRTHAAGTFALNCSFLGIPCIGYKGLDTQEILHPFTSVEMGDLRSARILMEQLTTDVDFYQDTSENTRKRWKEYYSEEKFKEHFFKTVGMHITARERL